MYRIYLVQVWHVLVLDTLLHGFVYSLDVAYLIVCINYNSNKILPHHFVPCYLPLPQHCKQ
jgi:hypothetical protein